MITRSKNGIFKPKSYLFVLLAQTSEPTSISQALSDPLWFKAMQEEFKALKVNHTWDLVLPTAPVKVIGNKWVFKIKYNPDGTILKYKVRLVAKGFHQTHSVDYTETFSPVVKASTVRVVLSITVMNNWLLRQIDVNNVFLNVKVQQVIQDMQKTFALKDLGELSYFLGIEVSKLQNGIHLSQAKYIADILAKHDLVNYSPVPTPMSTGHQLTKDSGSEISNNSQYRSIIGALQYVTLTRPKIAFTVNKLSQFLSNPRTAHWEACKRLLRYLKGTIHFGLQFYNCGAKQINCFTDSDWACDRDDRKSVARFGVYLDLADNNLSGSVPKCIGNLTAMVTVNSFIRNVAQYLPLPPDTDVTLVDRESVVTKGKVVDSGKILDFVKLIDISRNNFSGNIPLEVTNLRAL
ncbi:hypothetical protein KPL70_026754 [Citrus sinensis]|nr:hypothetical protein KPL70_026754 [Citrus sinensis]